MQFGPALRLLVNTAWAMKLDVLEAFAEILERHAAGVRLTDQEASAAIAEARLARGQSAEVPKSDGYRVEDGVAIIPIFGGIAKRADQINGFSQPRGTSTQLVQHDLALALADKDVKAIVLDTDSPGGSVDGISELGDAIYAARSQKPVYAFANGMMASAAYWLGSQASKIFVSPDAMVGSIGVYQAIFDPSRARENAGYKVHVIRSGAMKGAGLDGVTGEQMIKLQGHVDAYFDLFKTAVSIGRGMSQKQVDSVADGDVFIGKQAVDLGLADGVSTLSQVVDLARGGRGSTKRKVNSMDGEERLKALRAAFPAAEDSNFVIEQHLAGHDVTQAKAAKADLLALENKALKDKIAAQDAKTAQDQEALRIAEQSKKNKPLAVTQSDDVESAGGEQEYKALLNKYLGQGKTREQAVKAIVRNHPEVHRSMLLERNAGKEELVNAYFK